MEVLGAQWKKGPSSAQFISPMTLYCASFLHPGLSICSSLGLSGFRWCSQEIGYRGTKQVSKHAAIGKVARLLLLETL